MILYNPLYLTLITVLTILVVLSIEDPNVIKWVSLKLRLFTVGIQLFWFRFWLHPNNPITKFRREKSIQQFVKEMEREREKSTKL